MEIRTDSPDLIHLLQMQNQKNEKHKIFLLTLFIGSMGFWASAQIGNQIMNNTISPIVEVCNLE